MTHTHFSEADIRLAVEITSTRLACASLLQIEAAPSTDGVLWVRLNGKCARIAAPDLNALFRGVFLASRALQDGRALDVKEHRHFADCGVMLDLSRGAVMTVESVKEFLRDMAMLGMNYLQLYLEDTYTVPEYPYFGYLRGRYTGAELEEMDRYAQSLGIELVASIQTLGHMGQFLQWDASASLRDQPPVLMIGQEETYALIEAEIRACARHLHTRRIHVGMDEANGVGLGRYYKLYGAKDRFQLLLRHLERVCAICRKYDLEPIIWSDMFFRLGSEKSAYYDPDIHVPQEVIDAVAPVRLCYWDYYNRDRGLIRHMFEEHARVRPDTMFAGGIWTWSGFLPQIDRTFETSRASLPLCIEYGVSTVIAAMWGDDGAECDLLLGAQLLPVFSETCWQGAVPERMAALRMGAVLTGIPAEAYDVFSCFYTGWEDNRNGKGFVYCDPLYPLVCNSEPAALCAERLREGELRMEAYRDISACEFAYRLFRLAADKAELAAELRERYLRRDRHYLQKAADVLLPRMARETEDLCRAHRALWMKHCKSNGWEVLIARYGACAARLMDARTEILEYLGGERQEISALEEEPLPSGRAFGQFYSGLAFPGAGPL